MNPFEKFDQIYCLNLLERKDRWDQCVENFNNYEIKNYQQFLGIKIEDNNLSKKEKGQLGCALSFCQIFKDAKANNYKSILVLEDDFHFTVPKDNLFNSVNNCLLELPNDWDMFYLGGNLIADYRKDPIEKYSKNLFKVNSCYALHSVSFSRSGINKIISSEDWEKNLISNYEAIDVFFAKDFLMKNNCFLSKELLCTQRADFSSIEWNYFDYTNDFANRLEYFKKNI